MPFWVVLNSTDGARPVSGPFFLCYSVRLSLLPVRFDQTWPSQRGRYRVVLVFVITQDKTTGLAGRDTAHAERVVRLLARLVRKSSPKAKNAILVKKSPVACESVSCESGCRCLSLRRLPRCHSFIGNVFTRSHAKTVFFFLLAKMHDRPYATLMSLSTPMPMRLHMHIAGLYAHRTLCMHISTHPPSVSPL